MTHYSCSNCGAPIQPSQSQCHQCGADILWEQAVGRVQYIRKLPPLGPPRGPRFGTLVKVSALLVTVLGILLLAGLWGIERGLEERQAVIGEVAFSHYSQALLHLLDGDIPGARQEFTQIVRIQPQYTSTPAVVAVQKQTPTPQASLDSPTPTLSPNELTLDETLAKIQQIMEQGDWAEAVAQLQELSNLDPGYQSGLVGQMLFNAHFNLAKEYAQAGDIDAAAQELDAALRIHAKNAAAVELKQAITLYQTGKAQMGLDWDAAIDAFTQLYALNPDFMDTASQLFQAYAGAGDALRNTDPCQAMNRYQLALQIERDPQVRAKLENARLRCKVTAPSNADGTSTPAVGGPTTLTETGRIAYTFFDEEQTYHRTRIWDVAGMRPDALIAPESLQPDIGPENTILVRSTDPQKFGITLYAAPGDTPRRLTKDAGDSFPRWSPDGQSVLFSSASRTSDQQSHIFLLDLGSGRVQDLGLGQGGDWSPDGQNIVYQGCEAPEQKCGLWILDLATGQRRQLTTTPSDSMPRWSPNGQLIVFMSDGRSPSWDLFVVDAQTGNIPFFALDDALDGMPAWSPDGQWLAFLSNREGDWAVYSWSIRDLAVERLFPVGTPLPDWKEASLDWAP
ncbi:MAG: hypothetical protein GXP38_14530 [Chloroflexi bacterium]|nr:hypothetical protein [Chloroflexota bacterium]